MTGNIQQKRIVNINYFIKKITVTCIITFTSINIINARSTFKKTYFLEYNSVVGGVEVTRNFNKFRSLDPLGTEGILNSCNICFESESKVDKQDSYYVNNEVKGLAERYLEKYARKVENRRKTAQKIFIGIGGFSLVSATGGLIYSAISQDQELKDRGYIISAIGISTGIVSGAGCLGLRRKQPVEKEYEKIINMNKLTYEDINKRDYAASLALKKLADDAKDTRFVTAIISALAAAYTYIVRPYNSRYDLKDDPANNYFSIGYTMCGIGALLFKSEPEKLYTKYLKERKP